MRVRVAGHGVINFPDSMSEAEVQAVLKQFEKPKDDTVPKLLASIEKLLAAQKPQIVTEQKVVQVPQQVIMPKTDIKTVTVERIIEKKIPATSWEFEIDRDEDGMISNVRAYPNG